VYDATTSGLLKDGGAFAVAGKGIGLLKLRDDEVTLEWRSLASALNVPKHSLNISVAAVTSVRGVDTSANTIAIVHTSSGGVLSKLSSVASKLKNPFSSGDKSKSGGGGGGGSISGGGGGAEQTTLLEAEDAPQFHVWLAALEDMLLVATPRARANATRAAGANRSQAASLKRLDERQRKRDAQLASLGTVGTKFRAQAMMDRA
jgi:hypothetical protein